MALDKQTLNELMYAHQVVANWTGLPLAITEDEAKTIGLATAKLAKHYQIDMDKFGVWGAWARFVFVIGVIYVPRAMLISAWRAQMRQRAREAAATPVYPTGNAAGPASFADNVAAATNGAAAPEMQPAAAEPVHDPMDIEGLQRAS